MKQKFSDFIGMKHDFRPAFRLQGVSLKIPFSKSSVKIENIEIKL